MRRQLFAFAIAVVAFGFFSLAGVATGRDGGSSNEFRSLKKVPVPVPSGIGDFVADKTAAIALGKALFWDQQVGSDGIQACASCHFHAGADSRSVNQLNAGPNHASNVGGPNHAFTASDFPFHQLSTPDDPESKVTRDRDDIAGSQGVHKATFIDVSGARRDGLTPISDAAFNVAGENVRQSTGRNTPSAINAVFNVRNFWDGRANNIFNGRNPFGSADAGARVLVANDLGELTQVAVAINNSSLASQACGPPLSDVEMSGAARDFLKLGKKVLALRPLDGQEVKNDDSVLGAAAVSGGTGLSTTYADMIRAAFQTKWWNSDAVVDGALNVIPGITSQDALTTSQFTQMEANFSLFWGLAVQLYEATLVSDDAPFDRFMDGKRSALTDRQESGFGTFRDKCGSCHGGAEFSNATFSGIASTGIAVRMEMGNGGSAVYDRGFYNIGVRPSADDAGVGGSDPFGNPLSASAREQQHPGSTGLSKITVSRTARIAVTGAFKTPSLRNVELTGPYFHNGSAATLAQVVEFYTRGGNFRKNADLDPNIEEIGKLRGSPDKRREIVDFLKSLTDERVRFERAPFDHPQLHEPQGAQGNEVTVLDDPAIPGQGADAMFDIPAVGRGGSATPLATFLGLDPMGRSSALAAESSDEAVEQDGLAFRLMQNSPNPVFARTGTSIRFSLAVEGDVDLTVFDVAGRVVKSLAKGVLPAGDHSVNWDGTSDGGTHLPAGVYLYRIKTAGNVAERKMILVD